MEKKTTNLNGFIQDASSPFFNAENRGFRYGDGVFETMRLWQGQIPFSELHHERLLKGMKMLKFEGCEKFSLEKMCEEVQRLSRSTRIYKSARVRISVYREGLGYYTPESNAYSFLVELDKLETESYIMQEKTCLIDLFTDVRLSVNALSPLKTSNAIPFVLAGISAKERGLDEALLLNEKGNLVEGVSTNLFLMKDNAYFTPALGEGCTDGVMRKVLIGLLKEMKAEVFETAVPPAALEQADEVFLTNAIQGVRAVAGYRKKRYFNKSTKELLMRLNERVKSLYGADSQ